MCRKPAHLRGETSAVAQYNVSCRPVRGLRIEEIAEEDLDLALGLSAGLVLLSDLDARVVQTFQKLYSGNALKRVQGASRNESLSRS